MVLWELKSPAYMHGGAEAGMELPRSIVFGGLYTFSTAMPSISLAAHSTSQSGWDDAIYFQLWQSLGCYCWYKQLGCIHQSSIWRYPGNGFPVGGLLLPYAPASGVPHGTFAFNKVFHI